MAACGPVGSYCVADVFHDDYGNIRMDAYGCPEYNRAMTDRGVVSTGRSARQLEVQGLMVARKFDVQRQPGRRPRRAERQPRREISSLGSLRSACASALLAVPSAVP